MATHSCTPTWTWADSGGVGYTFPPTRVKSWPHQLLPTCKPSSPRPRSGPHHELQCQTQLWTKRSGSKGGHHHSSGCSSNTSTPKHPDSTSAKKPSNSKEPVPKEQDKSPKSCDSCKCGYSPSPSTKSAECKRKEAHTEDTHELNSTLPISSSGFDGFCSPMGSHGETTELQPPSITSTPLGLGAPRQRRFTSKESRHSLVSLYTSPGFDRPGYPVAGPGNLIPSIPSLAGSTTCPAPGPPTCSHQDHLLPT